MSFQHTKIQPDLKVKFYVNVFPTDKFDWDCLKIDVDKQVLYVKHLFEFHSSVNTKLIPKFWCFNTNSVFLNCCQDEVYSSVASHIFDRIFCGIDHTVLSYGQNYSGKSFTMSGFYNQFELRGITPRFVMDLFKQLENKLEDYAPKVCISVVDLHKNVVYDLLSYPRKICKELKDVTVTEVSSEIECLKFLFKAEAQRITVGNKPYNSHSGTNITTFVMRLVSINCNDPIDKVSTVHFVDLAGVETIFRNPLTSFKDVSNQGDANVTKTLLELFALRSRKTNRPQMSSTNKNIHLLTKYLGKSLSSSSSISLICHIRPLHEDINITLSTLRFGKVFQGIPVEKPQEHTKANYDMTLQKLTEEIKTLKDELLIIDLAEQKSSIKLSQERIDFVKRLATSFLNGELSVNELLSLVDEPSLILNVMKTLHNQPVPKSSVVVQTEFLLEQMGPKASKQDTLKADETLASSLKRVSIKDTLKEKPEQTKTAGKSKVVEKDAFQSEEVQVNLIEPNVLIPSLDSREGLWAMFLISRPDIHESLEKLNMCVSEKNKKLNDESTEYDNINQSVNKAQLALNQQVAYRHAEGQETYDIEGKVVVPEDETKLVQELRKLKRDLDTSKQSLIDAQFDWLEALEKFNNEKQVIEQEFKKFCFDNNAMVINGKITEEEEVCPRENESMTDTQASENDLKRIYQNMQKKYLHKMI